MLMGPLYRQWAAPELIVFTVQGLPFDHVTSTMIDFQLVPRLFIYTRSDFETLAFSSMFNYRATAESLFQS